MGATMGATMGVADRHGVGWRRHMSPGVSSRPGCCPSRRRARFCWHRRRATARMHEALSAAQKRGGHRRGALTRRVKLTALRVLQQHQDHRTNVEHGRTERERLACVAIATVATAAATAGVAGICIATVAVATAAAATAVGRGLRCRWWGDT